MWLATWKLNLFRSTVWCAVFFRFLPVPSGCTRLSRRPQGLVMLQEEEYWLHRIPQYSSEHAIRLRNVFHSQNAFKKPHKVLYCEQRGLCHAGLFQRESQQREARRARETKDRSEGRGEKSTVSVWFCWFLFQRSPSYRFCGCQESGNLTTQTCLSCGLFLLFFPISSLEPADWQNSYVSTSYLSCSDDTNCGDSEV